MKKAISILFVILIVPLLFACTKEGAVDGEYNIIGTIISLENEIEIMAEENELPIGAYVVLTGKQTKYYDNEGKEIKRRDLSVGDRIDISYNGQVTRSLPPQIFALTITVL